MIVLWCKNIFFVDTFLIQTKKEQYKKFPQPYITDILSTHLYSRRSQPQMRTLGAHAQPVQGVPANAIVLTPLMSANAYAWCTCPASLSINAEIRIRKLRKLNGSEQESFVPFYDTPAALPTRWPVTLMSHGLMAHDTYIHTWESMGLMARGLGHRTLQVPSACIRQGQVPVLFWFRVVRAGKIDAIHTARAALQRSIASCSYAAPFSTRPSHMPVAVLCR